MAVDRSRYNFNGKTRLTKKALIYEVVKKYIENSTDTLNELKNIFSEKSDFNIDMFVDKESYQSFNYDRKNRYFEAPFKLQDGTNIHLSTQWGGEVFQNLLQKIKQGLQYDIQLYTKQIDNKKKFINYLRRTPSQRGNIPDERRINYLVKVLKTAIPDKLNEVDNTGNNGSLFNVENINYLKQTKKRLNTGGDLYTWDQENHGQGGCSAALHQYIKFLNEGQNPLPSPENKIKNILLYGSPGVGKTHNTKKLIGLIEDGESEKEIFETIKNNELNDVVDIDDIKDRVKSITFHQSFGYEDFIEGFRPNENGDINLQDGVFKTICDDADNNRDSNYYLVIDEINRGNISKIFGELITLIEEDKRDTLEVTLPYSKKPFKIPSNLYIIGTMNSTDKSIALIDIALRRRFTFLKMEPNLDLVDNVKAKNIMKQLNEKITETLGVDYVLGHSYFMKIENDDDLDFVLEYKIKPLLEEYFYGDQQGLESIMKIVKYDRDDTE